MRTAHLPDSEKKFQCKDCEKGFSSKSALRDHAMNMHIKSQPYQCRYGCTNRYNDRANRTAHEKRRHKEEMRDENRVFIKPVISDKEICPSIKIKGISCYKYLTLKKCI